MRAMANLITLLRIALIAPFTAFFFLDAAWGVKAALAVFVVAAASDFLDGWVARARGQTSALGAALDPVADKMLIAAAFILLIRNGTIHDAGVIAAMLILLREILVAGLREALGPTGKTLPVSTLAKWKTTAQLLAAGFLIAASPGGIENEVLRPLAAGLLWAATALTVWTGAAYAVKAAGALRRSGRKAAEG